MAYSKAWFKVGDEVTIRDWDDMAEEFGVSPGGYIRVTPIMFAPRMKRLCGHTYTVLRITPNRVRGYDMIVLKGAPSQWFYCPSMFVDDRRASDVPDVDDEGFFDILSLWS